MLFLIFVFDVCFAFDAFDVVLDVCFSFDAFDVVFDVWF